MFEMKSVFFHIHKNPESNEVFHYIPGKSRGSLALSVPGVQGGRSEKDIFGFNLSFFESHC